MTPYLHLTGPRAHYAALSRRWAQLHVPACEGRLTLSERVEYGHLSGELERIELERMDEAARKARGR